MLEPQWHKLHVNREDACNFWACFSRVEFALKAAGYTWAPNGYAAANWTRFAHDIEASFDPNASDQLRAAVTYLLTEPPRRQIENGSFPAFEPVATFRPNATDLEKLVECVRRVRNNLFHGGKYFQPEQGDRDKTLLAHSLVVPAALVDLDQRVMDAYLHY